MALHKVGTYAFFSHPNLQTVRISASTIEPYAFSRSAKLDTVDLTSTDRVYIQENAFSECTNLTHLVIRSPYVASLSATSAFTGTKIANGDGGVYVPEDLLSSYKSATNWSTIADNIYPIGEYPKVNFDSIGDSWSIILSNASYATAYSVKDTKTLELTDGTKIKMDLAAIDTDVKSDNTGTAKMTWICHGIPYAHRMNATDTTAGGWADSEMRSWLISDILSKIPTEIKLHIVSVKKSYRSKSPNDETLWSDDEIWIPSYKEVGFTNASYIESDGVVYSSRFASNADRIKLANPWHLRSSGNGTSFWKVTSFGTISYNDQASVSDGVVFGFCTD